MDRELQSFNRSDQLHTVVNHPWASLSAGMAPWPADLQVRDPVAQVRDVIHLRPAQRHGARPAQIRVAPVIVTLTSRAPIAARLAGLHASTPGNTLTREGTDPGAEFDYIQAAITPISWRLARSRVVAQQRCRAWGMPAAWRPAAERAAHCLAVGCTELEGGGARAGRSGHSNNARW